MMWLTSSCSSARNRGGIGSQKQGDPASQSAASKKVDWSHHRGEDGPAPSQWQRLLLRAEGTRVGQRQRQGCRGPYLPTSTI